MAELQISDDDIVRDANNFALVIEPAEVRWQYCLGRVRFPCFDAGGFEHTFLNSRSFTVCDKITGCYPGGAEYRLRKLAELGWEGAQEWAAKRAHRGPRPFFHVGPLHPWQIGHVYLARVQTHPHIVKVGFSRRVRDRLADIEAQSGVKLFVKPGELFVGTLADEHWWHRKYAANRIAGEWFVDGAYPNTGLPNFLSAMREAA